MTVSVGDAALYLGADDTGLDRDLDRAEGKTKGWLDRISDGIGIAIGNVVVGAVGKLASGIASVGGQVLSMSADIDVATGQLQTRLGLTEQQALTFGDAIRQVYGDNFGESIDDVGNAVATVGQQLQALDQLTQKNLGNVTEYAISLRDAFDQDVGQSVNAAGVLVDKFGLSWDDAFSFITRGLQNGLNASDDFLDTITEYGVQFADGGANAAQFFSVMESGLQAGMLGTDKAADLFKEFRLRIQDGSDATSKALAQIGIDANDLAEQFADGSLTAIDAFALIQGKLAEVDDENVRFQAGVALMGSQYEDLGQSAAAGIDPALRGISELSGATDSLNRQYENLPTMFEGWKRRALLAMEPIGAKLLDLGNKVTPYVEKAFAFMEQRVIPVITGIAERFGGTVERIFGAVDWLLQQISGWGIDHLFSVFEDGTSLLGGFLEQFGMAEGPAMAFGRFISTIVGGLRDLWTYLTNLLQPIIDAVTQFVSFRDVLTAIGIILAVTLLPALASLVAGIIAALAPVILIVGGIALAVAALRHAWETDFGGIRDFAAGIWAAIQGAFAAFKALFSGDWDGFLEKIKGAWNAGWNAVVTFLGNLWSMVQPKLAEWWTAISAWFAGIDWGALGTQVITFIANAIGELWNFVWPKLIEWQNSVTAWFESVDWKQLAYDLITKILNGLREFDQRSAVVLQAWWDGIKAWFESIDWGSLARQIIDGLVSVLKGSSAFLDALLDMAKGAWEAVKDFFGVHSPSTLAMDLVRQIKTGLIIEADDSGGVDSSMGGMARRMYDAMTGQLSPVLQPATGNTYHSNLTIYTNAPYEPIAEDFRMMTQNWRAM